MADKVVARAVAADIAAAELAATQWGVVTARDLLACGMSRDMIAARLAAARLRRLHRGVYAWGHAQLRREGRLLASVLACGAGAAASHHSAADHLGLLSTARQRIDVTVAGCGTRTKRRGIELHVVRRLDRSDVIEERGVPVTTVARTIVDLAADRPPRHAERALEQAYGRCLLAPGALEDALARAAGRRTGVLRGLIGREGPTTFTRSELEEAMLATSRAEGLPDPQTNAFVLGYEVDFLWSDKRLIVETDGFGAHRTKRAFERDRRRDVDLALAGYTVARFTHNQVMLERRDTGRRLRALYERQ